MASATSDMAIASSSRCPLWPAPTWLVSLSAAWGETCDILQAGTSPNRTPVPTVRAKGEEKYLGIEGCVLQAR